MKKFNPRLWLGLFFVLWGVSALFDSMGIVSNGVNIFWGVVFTAFGLYFLNVLLTNRAAWWAAFPAFAFLGIAVSSLLPDFLDAIGDLIFFAGISLGFWWVYFTDKNRWWAIIPGGVLLTLGAISALDEVSGSDNGGFLFLGLGLTFILVAILPGGGGRSWAFIPGIVLLILGSIFGTPAVGLLEYVLPAVLIILGGYFVLRFFRKQSTQ